MAQTFNAQNQMSLRAFKAKHNDASVNIVKNPNTGSVFFECDGVKGYVSKKLADNLSSTHIDDIQYADCVADNGNIIPCLFIGSKSNVLKSF